MRLLEKCPACGSSLLIKSLMCTECGLELRNEFEYSVFDRLDMEQTDFLLCFLRFRGNLSMVQEALHLSYTAAKKRLNSLLASLGIDTDDTAANEEGGIELKTWITDAKSTQASEIIKAKLKESGGKAVVYSLTGKPYELRALADGKSFASDAIPIKPNYTYKVFDVIVDLLLSQDGKARKGLGRNARLGEKDCEITTVVGAIGKYYSGKNEGEYVFDPVFFLAAVLEWAGIARNGRGYLELTEAYKTRIECSDR